MYSFHGISNLDQFLRRNRSGRSFKSNLLEERERDVHVLILDWKNFVITILKETIFQWACITRKDWKNIKACIWSGINRRVSSRLYAYQTPGMLRIECFLRNVSTKASLSLSLCFYSNLAYNSGCIPLKVLLCLFPCRRGFLEQQTRLFGRSLGALKYGIPLTEK